MVTRFDLNGKWEFAVSGDTITGGKGRSQTKQEDIVFHLKEWMPATVPGCIHTDLMANSKINDPFYRFNEHNTREHHRAGWKYRRKFNLSADEYLSLMKRRVNLVCEGLDTFATILINGKLVGKAKNMYVEHEFDIKELLRKGENEIVILFESALRVGEELKKKYGETSSGYPFETRSYVRKAQYSFGWDWGPELPTMGIWKDIYIESYDSKIRDVCFRVLKADKKQAIAELTVETDATTGEQLSCEYELDGIKGALVTQKSRRGVFSQKIIIKNPRLWMPNGYGEPNLYSLNFSLISNGKAVDSRKFEVGIRTVELIREKDEEGKTFYFKINGVPVFCKGANFIPTDNFLPRTTDDKYRQLLQMAVDANMNMFRIWGGGIYEKDIFYSLCDKLGIMVWHDFMFACAIYPHKPFFLKNVEQEARKAIRRLRNHPCITLWSGENEDHWFFGEHKTKQYAKTSHIYWSKKWEWGQKIYHEILPQACAKDDPTTPYISGSPVGEGKNGDLNANCMSEGDRHSWDVWSGWRDAIEYQKDTGRFISEFGFQAPPNIATIRKYAIAEDLHPQSKWMEHHNKMGEGNPRLYKFLSDHFVVPTDLENFVHLCQVNQGEQLRIGVEHFRRRKFKTAGTIIWQINDCWCVSSWSLIDGETTPKLSYYYSRRFFAPLLLSIVEKDGKIEVWIINDTLKAVKGKMIARSMSFDGKQISEKVLNVNVQPNSSKKCFVTSRADMNITSTETDFFHAAFYDGEKILGGNNLVFDRIKFLSIPKPVIEQRISQISNTRFQITLSSKTFVKSCTIEFPTTGISLSDNAFDLVPGVEKTVLCETMPGVDSKVISETMTLRYAGSLTTERT